MKVLAVSGSLREGSSNTSVLRALGLLALPGTEIALHPPLDDLPFFNSDVEEAGLPPSVRDWRARVGACDAIVISSPEYAHGVSGVLKNALEWLVGGVEVSGKPVAVVNARPQATIAHAALVETLRVMGARVVDQTAVPLTGRKLDAHGIASDPELTALLVAVLEALREAVSEPAPPSGGPGRDELLRALLERNHGLDPEYGHGLSNHVSMGLYSLFALGGSVERLRAFAESHWPSLAPFPTAPGPAVTAGNWTSCLGRREALPGFRDLFGREVASLGRDGTLRRYLPDLLPGLAAAAFHSLIRTAYGARFRDDHEVIDGLAYWATAFQRLGPLPRTGSEEDPLRVLENVRATPELACQESSGWLISERMARAAERPMFEEKAAALAPGERALGAIAAAAVRLFAATGDFTALHAVTGTHALRTLLPFTGEGPGREGIRYLWQAVLAAYISIGAPAVGDVGPKEAPSWEAITAEAVASLDEHDLKLVEVAREEGSFYGDPVYRQAAALRMKLS